MKLSFGDQASAADVPSTWRQSPARDDRGLDFTGLALWTAGTLAGLVTAALVAQAPLFRKLGRRVGWVPDPGARQRAREHRPTPEQALPMLADAIIGNSKRSIARAFGAPHSAVAVNSRSPLPTLWDANTWYYPLPRHGYAAVAIEFADDLASRVHLLKPPLVKA